MLGGCDYSWAAVRWWQPGLYVDAAGSRYGLADDVLSVNGHGYEADRYH